MSKYIISQSRNAIQDYKRRSPRSTKWTVCRNCGTRTEPFSVSPETHKVHRVCLVCDLVFVFDFSNNEVVSMSIEEFYSEESK